MGDNACVTETPLTPAWLAPGSKVQHTTFGTGVVALVGDYEGDQAVWIDFDYGERKALSLEFGLPHLRRRARFSRTTPARSDLRCDQCGRRPVVLNVDNRMRCEEHRTLR